MKFRYLTTLTNHTPLSIALERNNKVCANAILKRFCKYIVLYQPAVFSTIEPVLLKLINSDLPALPEFLHGSLSIVKGYLPTYGCFIEKPPVVIGSDNVLIDLR